MGIDYSGIGGIGVELTEEMKEYAVQAGVFNQDWMDEGDWDSCFSGTGITWETAGSYYSGDITVYMFVDGNSLAQVMENVDDFIKKMEENFNVKLDLEDLKVISDYLIW